MLQTFEEHYYNLLQQNLQIQKTEQHFTAEHKTEQNYILGNQTINIPKSRKRITKEIEHINSNSRQRFKGKKSRTEPT